MDGHGWVEENEDWVGGWVGGWEEASNGPGMMLVTHPRRTTQMAVLINCTSFIRLGFAARAEERRVAWRWRREEGEEEEGEGDGRG